MRGSGTILWAGFAAVWPTRQAAEKLAQLLTLYLSIGRREPLILRILLRLAPRCPAVYALAPRSRPRPPRSRDMHYPHKVSNIKRVRRLGFRARMKTRLGRKMINRKRRMGRRITPV